MLCTNETKTIELTDCFNPFVAPTPIFRKGLRLFESPFPIPNSAAHSITLSRGDVYVDSGCGGETLEKESFVCLIAQLTTTPKKRRDDGVGRKMKHKKRIKAEWVSYVVKEFLGEVLVNHRRNWVGILIRDFFLLKEEK